MPADFGVTPRRDPRTHDIYVDEDGNVEMIEGNDLFRQECMVCLETIRGQEIIDPDYGFPLYNVMRNDFGLPVETLVRNAILDTLTRTSVPILASVDVSNISQDEEGNVKVSVDAKDLNGIINELQFGVDEIFQQQKD